MPLVKRNDRSSKSESFLSFNIGIFTNRKYHKPIYEIASHDVHNQIWNRWKHVLQNTQKCFHFCKCPFITKPRINENKSKVIKNYWNRYSVTGRVLFYHCYLTHSYLTQFSYFGNSIRMFWLIIFIYFKSRNG